MDRSFGLGQCYNIKFSPTEKYLVAGYENGVIDILNNCNERISRIRDAHAGGVNCFSWLNPHRFISCSDDSFIALWDLRMPFHPVQAIHLDDLTPAPFHSDEAWIKDLHFVPKDNEQNHQAIIFATAFSDWIYRIALNDDDTMSPLGPQNVEDCVLRSTFLPSTSQFANNMILSLGFRGNKLGSYFMSRTVEPEVELPFFINSGPLRFSYLNDGDALSARKPARQKLFYRSLKADPLGGGFLVRKTIGSKSQTGYSFVAYYGLEADDDDDAVVPNRMKLKFFHRDKSSEEIFQEPAFSPDGFFVANPQDRRIDILTNGKCAIPFGVSEGGAVQFNQAASIELPHCSDVLSCDISSDNLTVAAGCTMGHVHFARPVL